MKIAFCLALCFSVSASAQLAVTVSPVKTVGNKAVVPLAMKNNFSETVESAKAAVFLLDEQGKMVGQSSKWVIGGTKDRLGLPAGKTNSFFFVIANEKPFATTNLTPKVTFSRVVLADGKLVDPAKDVQITK